MSHNNISPFLHDKFYVLFSSSELPHFLEHSKQSRPTTLLVNKNKINLNNLMGLLKRRGIITEKINDYLLLVKEDNNLPIGATTEYLNGFYYIMGVSSAYAILSLKKQIEEMIFPHQSDNSLIDTQILIQKKIQMPTQKENKKNLIESSPNKKVEIVDDFSLKPEGQYKESNEKTKLENVNVDNIQKCINHTATNLDSDLSVQDVDTTKKNCEKKYIDGVSGEQDINKIKKGESPLLSDLSDHKKIQKKRKRLNKPVHINILDMCAAPGGKSIFTNILLSEHIRQKEDSNVSFNLFCVDNDEKRSTSLAANLIRMGMENTVVIADDALKACGQPTGDDKQTKGSKLLTQNLKDSKRPRKDPLKRTSKRKQRESSVNTNGYLPKMNLVILDAPCSGSGTLSKDIQSGNLDLSTLHSLNDLQRKLILSGYDKLKGNGLLFYSTCSVLLEENEMVVQFLLESRKNAKIVETDGIGRKGIKAFRGKHFDSDLTMARRIYPHTHNGDGFFFCLIRKCS